MRYFFVVGEASGDMHAAALMRQLKSIDSKAEFCFLGGDLMAEQGGTMVQHYKNMAFMGFVSVVRNIGTIAQNINKCKKAIYDFSPDVVILVDYPSFNLKIAKYVKETSKIPVYYYIAPKLWAWKEYRIKTIKRYVDKMFVVFPFEVEYFSKLGYKVDYVGNPIAERVGQFIAQKEMETESIIADSPKPIVALLCGSRRQEIASCMPLMAEMTKEFPNHQLVVAAAPGIEPNFYKPFLRPNMGIVYGKTYSLLNHSVAAVVNSGTATLEAALVGTPQVVVYKVFGGRLVSLLMRLFIKIPFVSLVNIIAQKEVVTELITPDFNHKRLKNELNRILFDSNVRNAMAIDYNAIRKELSNSSAADNCANLIYSSLIDKQGETVS